MHIKLALSKGLGIRIFFLLAGIIAAVIIFRMHKPFFVFIILLFLASVSRTYNHLFFLPQLGFELYSPATILTGLLLGPLPGLLQGVLSNFFAYLLSGKIKFYVVISMVAWGIIGFVCGLIQNLNFSITMLGIFFVLLYELITVPIFVSSGARITSAAFHFVTHLLITIFLFTSIVPFLYNLLR